MTWGVVLHHDGQPVTGLVPCDDWSAALHAGEIIAALTGGTVSISRAVMAARPAAGDPSLFDEEAT